MSPVDTLTVTWNILVHFNYSHNDHLTLRKHFDVKQSVQHKLLVNWDNKAK